MSADSLLCLKLRVEVVSKQLALQADALYGSLAKMVHIAVIIWLTLNYRREAAISMRAPDDIV